MYTVEFIQCLTRVGLVARRTIISKQHKKSGFKIEKIHAYTNSFHYSKLRVSLTCNSHWSVHQGEFAV